VETRSPDGQDCRRRGATSGALRRRRARVLDPRGSHDGDNHVRDVGEAAGFPVLLLHGQMLDGSLWDDASARLGATRRVLVPDLPGYGRSAAVEPFTLPRIGEWIEELLAARGVAQVDVAGYSLGAYHALALALHGRVRVRSLYLLAPYAGADEAGRAVMAGYAAAVRSGVDYAAAFAAMAFPREWTEAHPSAVASVEARVRALPAETLAAELSAIAAAEDLRPRLREIDVPVVVRSGTGDRNVPLADAAAIAGRLRAARLETVDGVAHLPLVQDREATLASLAAFFAAGAR
jgi:3-oxoadipate enol-lactonase